MEGKPLFVQSFDEKQADDFFIMKTLFFNRSRLFSILKQSRTGYNLISTLSTIGVLLVLILKLHMYISSVACE